MFGAYSHPTATQATKPAAASERWIGMDQATLLANTDALARRCMR